MIPRGLILVGILVCTGSALFAQNTVQVTVDGNQGPWNQSLNPKYVWGVNDNAGPTVISAANGIPFVAGDSPDRLSAA